MDIVGVDIEILSALKFSIRADRSFTPEVLLFPLGLAGCLGGAYLGTIPFEKDSYKIGGFILGGAFGIATVYSLSDLVLDVTPM